MLFMCVLLYYSIITLATGIKHTVIPIVLAYGHVGYANSAVGLVMGE
jgi:hypothetical protein